MIKTRCGQGAGVYVTVRGNVLKILQMESLQIKS